MNCKFSDSAKPFLKWAGGKGQLLAQLEAALPIELRNEEFDYVEPSVGGGAMLFFMLQKFPNIRRVVINDINSNLTNAYTVIKLRPHELVSVLKDIDNYYRSLDGDDSKKNFYLEKRREYNEQSLSEVEKAAVLLFLNRTCFNGLYRENSKGLFNVPFGKYANPTICNEAVIYADSELLNHFDVQIMNEHFKNVKQCVSSDRLNFFYFDPPYRPLSETSSFNSYVKDSFNDDSQIELANFCSEISKKQNVKWMLSNSDCSAKNPSDHFFEIIYRDFYINRVYASRAINANPSKRGKLSELLISNYKLDNFGVLNFNNKWAI